MKASVYRQAYTSALSHGLIYSTDELATILKTSEARLLFLQEQVKSAVQSAKLMPQDALSHLKWWLDGYNIFPSQD